MTQITYTIPESIAEITLADYQRFHALPKGMPEQFYYAHLVSIFCKVPIRAVDYLPLADLQDTIQSLELVIQEATAHINHRNPFPIIPEVTIDGVVYGFHPNISALTFDEFVDMDTYALEVSKWHKMAAVLYRPITKKQGRDSYLIQSYRGTAHSDAIEKISMEVFLGVLAFFLTIGHQLATDTLKSLTTHQVTNNPQISAENGDGTRHFFNLLVGRCETWMEQVRLAFTRPCTFFLTSRTLLD